MILTFECRSQNMFPVIRLEKEIMDSIAYIDSLKLDKYKGNLTLSHPTNHRYRKAFFISLESPYFGSLDSVVFRCCIDFPSDSISDDYNKYFSKTFYSFNKGIDTFIVKNDLYIEVNPFPNIFAYYDERVVDGDTIIELLGEPHYSFHSNFLLKSSCMYNNQFGTVKYFWNSQGQLTKHGAFLLNVKNGPWHYYDSEGNRLYIEYYDQGKLVKTE